MRRPKTLAKKLRRWLRGRRAGRTGKSGHRAADRRQMLLAGIDVARARGLEVSPLNRATVRKSEGDVTYIDRSDYETLLELHKNDPNVSAPILPVDVAVGERPLPEALAHLGRFDYIVASHVVEHVPDLVAWFEELRAILKPDGTVRLAVPDKRYTFDHLRTETCVTEVIDSHIRGNRHPSSHSVLDQLLNARRIDLEAAWQGTLGDVEAMPPVHSVDQALECARVAAGGGTYYEVHCWAFTPRSFGRLCYDLARYGLLRFKRTGHFDTPHGSFEFFVHMAPCDSREEAIQSWRAMAGATT